MQLESEYRAGYKNSITVPCNLLKWNFSKEHTAFIFRNVGIQDHYRYFHSRENLKCQINRTTNYEDSSEFL